MACSDCGGGCSCVIIAGPGAAVSGAGLPSNPYRISTAGPISPDWQATNSRTWDTDTVSLADLAEPVTIEVSLEADVTSLATPVWLETVSGIITLVITNTGSYSVVFPGLTAGGIAVGVTDNGITLIHLLWTGQRWIVLLGAAALS